MRVCIVGAGAIGGLMGAKLALSGEEVTVIDQGAHLEAIKENGLKLIWEDGTEYVAEVAKATDNLEEVGEQDLIILGLKAHYLDQVAKEISLITGPETMIVTVAAGQQPKMGFDLLHSMETMTAYIVQVSLGETPQGSLEYKTIFAVGLLLFAMTLVMNIVGRWVISRFRQQYN